MTGAGAGIRRSLARMAIIVCASGAAGAVYIEGFRGLPWVPTAEQLRVEAAYRAGLGAVKDADARDAILAAAAIDIDTFLAFAERGALVVDARQHAADFAAGHLAAPFIIHLPPESLIAQIDLFEGVILDGVPIVIYCESETCEDSKVVYRELRQFYGEIGRVFVYPAGWAGILAAQAVTATGEPLDAETVISECHGEFYARGGAEAFEDLPGGDGETVDVGGFEAGRPGVGDEPETE